MIPPSICPVCGCEVPKNSRACPDCGADERTGWAEDADLIDDASSAGIPDQDFDYDDFLKREFGNDSAPETGKDYVWAVIIALLLIALVIYFRSR